MKSQAIRQIRKILGDEGLIKEDEDFEKALSLIQAKFLRLTEQYRCSINFAQSRDEKLKIALECITFLTEDKTFLKKNMEKVREREVQKVS